MKKRIKDANKHKIYSVHVGEKSLTMSAGFGEHLGNNVDIYLYNKTFAIINNPFGDYRLRPFSKYSERMQINSRPLVRYIKAKYLLNGTAKLSAWSDGKAILFCMREDIHDISFHKGFSKISNLLRFRYENSIRIIGYKFYISALLSENLGKRLNLIRYNNGFAFINDNDGNVYTNNCNISGTKTIQSRELVQLVKEEMGTDFLYGKAIDGGIFFSKENHVVS